MTSKLYCDATTSMIMIRSIETSMILQGMEEGVTSIKAEVVNKVQEDLSEGVNNGIEQVMQQRVAHACSKFR